MAIVMGFLFLYAIDQIFRAREIIIQHSGKRSQLVGVESLYYAQMFFLDEEAFANEILRANPYAAKVTVKKELPQTVTVTIEWQQPFVQLKTPEGVYLLGEDARILEKRQDVRPNLPILTYYQRLPFSLYQAGKKIDFRDILMSFDFLIRLQRLGYKVDSIEIQDFSLIRYNSSTKQFLFSADKDSETQWYQAERLIKELRIRGEDFSRIDVRFEKPLYEPV